MKAYVLPTTIKLRKDANIEEYKTENKAIVFGAKGETVAFQVVLRFSKACSFTVDFDALKGECGEIKVESESVKIEQFVYCDKGFTQEKSGYYPDELLPYETAKEFKENVAEKDDMQILWVDVKIPQNAKSGKYESELIIKGGEERAEIPVEVKVYDFKMPTIPPFATTVLIWQDWLKLGEKDSSVKTYKAYYDKLLKYHISGYYFPHKRKDVNSFVRAMRKYYNKVFWFGIPYVLNTAVTVRYDYLEEILTAIGKACLEDNVDYFAKAYYYFDKTYDELSLENYDRAKECIDSTNRIENEVAKKLHLPKDMAKSINGIRHDIPLVKGYNDALKEFKNDIIICPLYDNFGDDESLKLYKRLQDEGYIIHSYGAASFYPNAAHLIDDYTVTTRDLYWSKYKLNLWGDLYWNANCYCDISKPDGKGGFMPIDDLYNFSSHDGVTNGDGYWFYPMKKYGLKSPIASIRLSAMRDGINDYTYFKILEEEYLKLGESSNAVTEEIMKTVINGGRSRLNFYGLIKRKEQVAKLIELAKKFGFALTCIDSDTVKGKIKNKNAKIYFDGELVRVHGGEFLIDRKGKDIIFDVVGRNYKSNIDLKE